MKGLGPKYENFHKRWAKDASLSYQSQDTAILQGKVPTLLEPAVVGNLPPWASKSP